MSIQREQSPTKPADWHVVEAWVSSLKVKKQGKAAGNADAINDFLEFAGKPIADITLEDALEYIGHLSESGRSRSTVALHISAVRAFVEHCRSLGLLAQTPLDGSKETTVAAGDWMNRHSRHSEVERLLAAARDVLRAHPLGRSERISIVLGAALPILLWILSDGATALGLFVMIVTVPLWIGAIRVLFYIGKWMLAEPEGQASNPD